MTTGFTVFLPTTLIGFVLLGITMLFRRKPKNRRFERENILDVKLSSRQRRQVWVRRLGMLLLVLFVVGVGVFVAWRGGEYLLDRFVYNNPAFAIHQLDIQTDGVLSLEQLRAWAGVRLRDNLMALDLARIKRDLELVPAIETAAVERVLPHMLRIRVTEREPIAQVGAPPLRPGVPGSGMFTLDAKGFFMFPIEPQQRAVPARTNEHLPVITGIAAADIRSGRQSELPQVHAALRLIQAFERSPMAGLAELKQIDLTTPHLLQMTTSQSNEVVLGLSDPEPQLRRWRAVADHGWKLGRHLAWIDLSVSNNVPARWWEARPGMTTVAARTNTPSLYRKKHV